MKRDLVSAYIHVIIKFCQGESSYLVREIYGEYIMKNIYILMTFTNNNRLILVSKLSLRNYLFIDYLFYLIFI